MATGVAYRRLDAPGVEELVGCGVSYGSVPAQAPSHREQDVVLVGGANSAGQAALHLAQYACTVTMIVRAPSLDAAMSRDLVDRIRSHPRIKSAPAVASPGRQAARDSMPSPWRTATATPKRCMPTRCTCS